MFKNSSFRRLRSISTCTLLSLVMLTGCGSQETVTAPDVEAVDSVPEPSTVSPGGDNTDGAPAGDL